MNRDRVIDPSIELFVSRLEALAPPDPLERTRRPQRPEGDRASLARLKRGAGAGWTLPSTSTNAARARACG